MGLKYLRAKFPYHALTPAMLDTLAVVQGA